MTSKLTITRERMQEIAEDGFLKHGESKELARMALSAMDCEPVAYIDKQWTLVYYVPPMSMGLKIGDKLYRHAQPAPVVMDDRKLRALFDSWFASDCSFDRSPEASEADNIAWRESYWYVWQHCRAAMLQAGTLTNEDTRQVDELTMWIKRLVRSLKNANPDSKLPREAMDYLTAKGLISVGDILR